MPTGTPWGFRDILPNEALDRERIAAKARACFSQRGYMPVETPLLEYRNVLEQGSQIDDSPFQLFDRMAISGGRRGLSLILSPEDLRRFCSAAYADIIRI